VLAHKVIVWPQTAHTNLDPPRRVGLSAPLVEY
jgi:hypothetical protein